MCLAGFGAYQSLGRGILDTFLTVLICVCVSCARTCECASVTEREKREKMCIDTLFRKKASHPLKLGIYTTLSSQSVDRGWGLCSGGMGIELRSLVRTVNINS